jgi:hypothetical protein
MDKAPQRTSLSKLVPISAAFDALSKQGVQKREEDSSSEEAAVTKRSHYEPSRQTQLPSQYCCCYTMAWQPCVRGPQSMGDCTSFKLQGCTEKIPKWLHGIFTSTPHCSSELVKPIALNETSLLFAMPCHMA